MNENNGDTTSVSSTTDDSAARAILAKLSDSPAEVKDLAYDILRFREVLTSSLQAIVQRENEMREYFETHPAKSEATVLADKIVEFANAIDKIGAIQKRNVEAINDLTTVAGNLLETVNGFHAAASAGLLDLREHSKIEITKFAGKIRLPRMLSVRETLILHGIGFALWLSVIVILLLKR